MYAYGGRFYSVPEFFEFPKKTTLREAIRLWLKGITVNQDGDHVVKPFGKLSIEMLPKNLKQTFKTQWRPIFKFLEPATKEIFARDFLTITEDDIETTHNCCVEYLKKNVSYCWNTLKRSSNPLKYSIGTWSNKTSHASITKHGTEEDKKKLQAPSGRNASKKAGLKRIQQSSLQCRVLTT